jgi:dihydroorotate dehydrogenase electron transfer subunit
MHTAQGRVLELILEDGLRLARIACPQTLIPAPGQYLLASSMLSLPKRDDSGSPLPAPLFHTDSNSESVTAASAPESWKPGTEIFLRGPLGRGFSSPGSARRVALAALDGAPACLRGLIRPALKQEAAIVLVCDGEVGNLPDEVEVQPSSSLEEAMAWADYAVFDVRRENLPQWREKFGMWKQALVGRAAEVLVRTPIPCGGIAECGVCAVNVKSGWRFGCKDGPVLRLDEIA